MARGALRIGSLVKRKLYRWLPPLLWMVLIFTFSGPSGLPNPAEPGTLADFLLWKTVHLLAYAILAGLLWWALQAGRGQTLKVRAFGGSWTICSLFGAFNEYYQRSVPGREGTWIDVSINSVGALLGLVVIWWLIRGQARETAT